GALVLGGGERQDRDVPGTGVPLGGGQEVTPVHVLLQVEDDDRRLVADGQLQDLLGRRVGDVGQASATGLAGQGGHDAGLIVGDQDGGLLGHWTLASWLDRKIHTGPYLQRARGAGWGAWVTSGVGVAPCAVIADLTES